MGFHPPPPTPPFSPSNNGTQYKPAQSTAWCSPTYFIAPDALVWKYLSVVTCTLRSPLTFSLANLSFCLTHCIRFTWRKLLVLI